MVFLMSSKKDYRITHLLLLCLWGCNLHIKVQSTAQEETVKNECLQKHSFSK